MQVNASRVALMVKCPVSSSAWYELSPGLAQLSKVNEEGSRLARDDDDAKSVTEVHQACSCQLSIDR